MFPFIQDTSLRIASIKKVAVVTYFNRGQPLLRRLLLSHISTDNSLQNKFWSAMFIVFTLRLNFGSLFERPSNTMIFELENLELVYATSSFIYLVSTAFSYISMSLHRMQQTTTFGGQIGLFSDVMSTMYLSASSVMKFYTLCTYAFDPAINLELMYLMFDVPIKRTLALCNFFQIFPSEPRSYFPIFESYSSGLTVLFVQSVFVWC